MYRIIQKSNKAPVMIEYSPMKRSIMYTPFSSEKEYSMDDAVELRVQFPTTLFLKFPYDSRLYVAFAPTPVKSIDDMLYCPTLPNLYYRWNICGCECINLVEGIKTFWGVGFNEDGSVGHNAMSVVMGVQRLLPQFGLRALQKWEEFSLETYIERLIKYSTNKRPFWMFATGRVENEIDIEEIKKVKEEIKMTNRFIFDAEYRGNPICKGAL